MRNILFQSGMIENEYQAHEYIGQVLGIPKGEAVDLDRIYMEIMSIREETEIELEDYELLVERTQRFGLGLLKLLRDAARESEYINFIW